MRNSKAKEKELRLHEGELNVMELLWSNKVLAATKALFPVKIQDSSVALKFQKRKFKRLKPMHCYLRCLMVHLLIS